MESAATSRSYKASTSTTTARWSSSVIKAWVARLDRGLSSALRRIGDGARVAVVGLEFHRSRPGSSRRRTLPAERPSRRITRPPALDPWPRRRPSREACGSSPPSIARSAATDDRGVDVGEARGAGSPNGWRRPWKIAAAAPASGSAISRTRAAPALAQASGNGARGWRRRGSPARVAAPRGRRGSAASRLETSSRIASGEK